MEIRTVTPEDYPAVYELVKTAFQTAKCSDGKEQDFVETLRTRPGFVQSLEVAAEADGVLLGHILLTQLPPLTGPAGEDVAVRMIAPLCVRLENRDCGLGAHLMHEGMRRARALGCAAVFLLGDPGYYGRFGFRAVTAYGLENRTSAPDGVVLGRELVPGALTGVTGGVRLE